MSSAPSSSSLLPILNEIRIASPCGADWSDMRGTERERQCALCKKTVHDLALHTAAEAVALVAVPDADVCVRLLRDPNGNVVTKDSPREMHPTRRGWFRRAALLAASWLGLTAASGCDSSRTFSRVTGSVTSATGSESQPWRAEDVSPPVTSELIDAARPAGAEFPRD